MGEGQQHNLGNHQFLSTLNVKSSSNLKHLSDETVYRRKTFEEIGETLLNRNRDSSAKKSERAPRPKIIGESARVRFGAKLKTWGLKRSRVNKRWTADKSAVSLS